MEAGNKIYLNVKVLPRARKRRVEKLDSENYKVWVLTPPLRGEANKEVIETLASYFGVPPSFVKIIKGQKSRNKRITVETKS